MLLAIAAETEAPNTVLVALLAANSYQLSVRHPNYRPTSAS